MPEHPGDQLQHALCGLRAVQGLLCGEEESLSEVSRTDLFFLLTLIIERLDAAAVGYDPYVPAPA